MLYPFNNLFSQVGISFDDTSIQRGRIYEIPVYGSVSGNSLTDLTLIFSFDSHIIDVKGALGGDKYAIKTLNPSFGLAFPRLDSAVIRINSTEIQPVSNGIICMLQVEGLVYSDSLAKIVLRELILNGAHVPELKFKEGTIKVLGDAYLSHLPDDLGQCTPNPFVGQAKFGFSIENPSKVRFIVYSVLGRLVMTSDDNEFDQFVAKSQEKNLTYKKFNQTFESGDYVLLFNPSIWDLSQGLYFMVMQTDKGAYKTNFLYFKQ